MVENPLSLVFMGNIKSVGIVLYSSLSSLSLYPLCSLRFNHSDTTGMDISPDLIQQSNEPRISQLKEQLTVNCWRNRNLSPS